MKESIRSLVREFSDVFQTALGKAPAQLPAMKLNVDTEAWNRLPRHPPRTQTLQKQTEIRALVDAMLASGIIEVCDAQGSQVLLVPKPNGTWRFCVDFRWLNDLTKDISWPLPNIAQMLQRLGQSRSKYFGVMDLTSGYHQMLLSKDSKKYTAFVTHFGTYQFTRVPFGLKGAPSYFQQLMVARVLNQLVYNICEVYLDDVIVYAKTEEEFVAHTRRVLERMRQFNVKVHPKKTRLGLSVIEYVGHTVDNTGMCFTKVKTDAVFQTPLPKTEKELKSFLGLANYFRDHIQGYSDMARPLNTYLHDYKKYSTIKWSDTLLESFQSLKDKINDCPKLFFLQEDAPVVLHTDASDYGIGAYLFQTRESKEYPIAFMSKTLTESQIKNWTTTEKEAYAIVVAFEKFEYLLRDVRFLLRTDHRNLTFLNDSYKGRVIRWKLAIQEYNFAVEHIPGKDNIVADALSRDLPNNTTVNSVETLDAMTPSSTHGDVASNPTREVALQQQARPVDELLADSLEVRLPDDIYRKIELAHNPTVGHHGVDQTMRLLRESGHTWPDMRAHVSRFIRKCPTCQKLSEIKPHVSTPPYTLAAYEPGERINIDSIGPFTEDLQGNKHIIVIIDCFTRFVELYPTPSTEAKYAAKALLDYAGRYGVPAQVQSDNGTQYVNRVISELLEVFGSKHILSTPYSHEENGIVERVNKEVLKHLRALVLSIRSTDTWSTFLPLVQRIINSSIHKSIGVSPAQILFGKAITLDRGMLIPPAKDHPMIEISEYMHEMLRTQGSLIALAQKTQKETDDLRISARLKRNKQTLGPTDADATVTVESSQGRARLSRRKRLRTRTVEAEMPLYTEFEVGSMVLLTYPNERMGSRAPNKLMAPNKGPLRVKAFQDQTYDLEDIDTGAVTTAHISRIKPFNYDADRVDPGQIAKADARVWDIEEIIAHRGKPSGPKSQLSFHVRWSGTDDTGKPWDLTWSPWEELRNTAALHAYLRKKNLESLIPVRFRE
jgi:hypothetical protein